LPVFILLTFVLLFELSPETHRFFNKKIHLEFVAQGPFICCATVDHLLRNSWSFVAQQLIISCGTKKICSATF